MGGKSRSLPRFLLAWLTCVLVVLSCTSSLKATAAYYPLQVPPTDVTMHPWDGRVIVSAGRKLSALNPDLTLNSSINTIGGHIGLIYNNTENILMCTDEICKLYLYVDWANPESHDTQLLPKRSVSTTLVPVELENRFYIGSTDGRKIEIEEIDSSSMPLRSLSKRITNRSFYKRKFLHAFENGDSVYFLVRDNGTNDLTTSIRVMRVCQDVQYYFKAVYETVLECGNFSANSQVIFSDTATALDEPTDITLTLAVTTDGVTNICKFSTADIDLEMNSSYSKCVSGNFNELMIPIVWYDSRTCGDFNVPSSKVCDFRQLNKVNEVPVLATFNSVVGTRLLQLNSSAVISAILAYKVDSIDLLLISYTKNNEHFLANYHIRSSNDVELVSIEQQERAVVLLQWNTIYETIYGATNERVFSIPLENCSQYDTCSSCASSGNPMCGWCVLDSACTRQIFCGGDSTLGDWAQEPEQCILSISLQRSSMAVDFVQNVSLAIEPPMAQLPSLHSREYGCMFSNEESAYNFTTRFSHNRCLLADVDIPSFIGTEIALNFELTINGTVSDHFPTFYIFTLFNCTQFTTCTECVEASTSCGWCVYDHMCSGLRNSCRQTGDWRSLTSSINTSVAVCPAVLTPANGYSHPVNKERDLILSTLNMPPEIDGFHYVCQLEYSNGTKIAFASTYTSDTSMSCNVLRNQVQLLTNVDNGFEATSLDLQWVQESNGHAISINTQTVHLYDCLLLGSDCSSCFSANIGSSFECIWCDRTLTTDECSLSDFCQTESTLIDETSRCPFPIIQSITPMTGPTEGGTMLTLMGSNLGAQVDNVTVKLVNSAQAKEVVCVVDKNQFVPGKKIMCMTQIASEGPYTVVLEDVRGSTIATTSHTSANTFHYVVPVISLVFPLRGPKAGGTEIALMGSGLDISSPNHQAVYIGDIECKKKSVKSDEIVCVTQPVVSAGSRRIHVIIDGANKATFEFMYTENPVFRSVYPQNIIPAGGITLNFRGKNLNVVVRPLFIMTVGNFTQESRCQAKSSSVLKCTAPRIPNLSFRTKRRAIGGSVDVNYTIVMDGAVYSVGGRGAAQGVPDIVVRRNPVFSEIHEDDLVHTIDSKRTIRIMGENIDSVVVQEIEILVDEEECILVSAISATEVRCRPPKIAEPGDKEVTVTVAKTSLNYSVGFLRYKQAAAPSGGNSKNTIVIIVSAIGGLVILLMIGLSIALGIIGCALRRKRVLKKQQLQASFGQQSKDAQMGESDLPHNLYNRPLGSSNHDYDTIPEVLAQMEIARCAAQGVPLNSFDMHPTSQSGNLAPSDVTAVHTGNIYSSDDEGKGSSTRSQSRSQCSSTGSQIRPLSSTVEKSTKTAPLPPLPSSISDEYVAMNSFLMLSTPTHTGDQTVAAIKLTASEEKEKETATEDAPAVTVTLQGRETDGLNCADDISVSSHPGESTA